MSVIQSTPSMAGSSRSGDHESREAHSPPGSHSKAASRRRDKLQLSCNVCRQRKLRCDRSQPACQSCISRRIRCVYPENYTASVLSQTPVIPHVLERLEQLEALVASIMPDFPRKNVQDDRSNPQRGTINPQAILELSYEHDNMSNTIPELRYVSGEHWRAILDGIADIKDSLSREDDLLPTATAARMQSGESITSFGSRQSSRSMLLYGGCPPCTREGILASLPPKSAVDRSISRYFNGVDLISSTIHGPTFLQQYDRFWSEPSAVPILWIGLLFSMICLATLSSNQIDTVPRLDINPHDSSSQIDLLREKVIQCLVTGQYTDGGPYALEVLMHYIYIEFATRTDANKDIWFLLAIEVNLALRMGFHRDPSHFPALSPFQAEMRRRVWATILLSDGLISSQMGMPRMISDGLFDTAEPRNLNDTDFSTDTKELPRSRPDTEFTTVLRTIAQRRAIVAVGAVSDLVKATQPYSYEQIMTVDNILEHAAADIPASLKPRDMTASLTDSPPLIMARLFISHIFHKGKIMLHQRFLSAPSDQSEGYAFSQKACLEASLGLLHIQNILKEKTSEGGQLQTMRWRVSSIMNHQFLTATMILCSCVRRKRTRDPVQERDLLAALRRCRQIWLRNSAVSREAAVAARAVSLVIAGADADIPNEDGLSTNFSVNLQDVPHTASWSPFNGGELREENQGLSDLLNGGTGVVSDWWNFPESTDSMFTENLTI